MAKFKSIFEKKKSSETHDFTSGDLKVSYSGRKHMDEGP